MISILELIPAVMGLPTISESMDALIDAMSSFPAATNLGVIQSWAKIVGLCLALGVGANECFQMMLGRRGLDVMKLLHIVIISMCITSAGWIANAAQQPGILLEMQAKGMANEMNEEVRAKEEEVAALQEEYLDKVREQLRQLEENQEAENDAKDENWWQQLKSEVKEVGVTIQNRIKEMTILLETKICEWVNLIIRFFGEILFQVAYYGLLISQRIFIHILAAFGPLMFALSLAPHYKSAWSQWLSKLLSLSLWGFVAYICVYYVDFIMLFNLQRDVTSYETLIGSVSADTDGDTNIAAIGMQAIGTTCMYVVGLLVGVRVLAFVPEVASWLIPGGVASGAGGAAAGMATSAGMMAGNAAGAITGHAVSAAPAIASAGMSSVGAMGRTAANYASNTAMNMANFAGMVAGGASLAQMQSAMNPHLGSRIVNSAPVQSAVKSVNDFGNRMTDSYNKGKSGKR